MAKERSALELEVEAIELISEALKELGPESQRRVLAFVSSALLPSPPPSDVLPLRRSGVKASTVAGELGERLFGLLAEGPRSARELSAATGAAPWQVRKVLSEASGVRRVGAGRGTTYALANGGAR